MRTLPCIILATAALGFGGSALAESGRNLESIPYVAPRVFKVKTTEVQCIRELRNGTNAAGEEETYTVTVVIYQELFSDGTIRTQKRSFRSGMAENQS